MFPSQALLDIAGRFASIDDVGSLIPLGNGRINDTYLLATGDGRRYVLQRLADIFLPTVLEDIHYITRMANMFGFRMPSLVLAQKGGLGVTDTDGATWRMYTYEEGVVRDAGVTPAQAASATRLIGKFHTFFVNDRYVFRHVRPGFHKTRGILETLATRLGEADAARAHGNDGMLRPVTKAILACGERSLSTGEWERAGDTRIIHGDPKLANILFDPTGTEAITLLDLDTMGRRTVLIDLADAARSWCNLGGEDDVENVAFDLPVFRAMMEGYAETAAMSALECALLPFAIERIALELAARSAIAAYNTLHHPDRPSFFKLNERRWPDIYTQYAALARGQLRLAYDIRAKRGLIAKAIP